MEFKIDATDQYTVITPESATLSTAEAALLADHAGLATGNVSNHFIIDLQHCRNVTIEAVHQLADLSMAAYEQGYSFIVTHPPEGMAVILKAEDLIDVVNCAPTFQEAIDILNMEKLERDLENEDSF